MTTATITEQYILNAIHQETEGERFPILFDEIWETSGYKNKKHAVRFLTERCAVIENEHYVVVPNRGQTPQGGRSSDFIRLSTEGYHFFLSKSNTKQGDANLWYLIEVEKQYRKTLERQLAASVQPQVNLVQENADLKLKLKAKTQELESQLNKLVLAEDNYNTYNEVLRKEIAYLRECSFNLKYMDTQLAFNYFNLSLLNGCLDVIYDMIPNLQTYDIPELTAKLAFIKKHMKKTLDLSIEIIENMDIDVETPECMKQGEAQLKEYKRYLDLIRS
jgi:hypothetical protein